MGSERWEVGDGKWLQFPEFLWRSALPFSVQRFTSSFSLHPLPFAPPLQSISIWRSALPFSVQHFTSSFILQPSSFAFRPTSSVYLDLAFGSSVQRSAFHFILQPSSFILCFWLGDSHLFSTLVSVCGHVCRASAGDPKNLPSSPDCGSNFLHRQPRKPSEKRWRSPNSFGEGFARSPMLQMNVWSRVGTKPVVSPQRPEPKSARGKQAVGPNGTGIPGVPTPPG